MKGRRAAERQVGGGGQETAGAGHGLPGGLQEGAGEGWSLWEF